MTRFERVAKKAIELKGEGLGSVAWNKAAEFGKAICEEIDELEERIEALEKRKK